MFASLLADLIYRLCESVRHCYWLARNLKKLLGNCFSYRFDKPRHSQAIVLDQLVSTFGWGAFLALGRDKGRWLGRNIEPVHL